MAPSSQPVGVIDTSSIIKVKELLPSFPDQQKVFSRLTVLAKKALLTYPKHVVDELSRKAEKDFPYQWAEQTKRYLKYGDPPFGKVREVMRKAVSGGLTVVDPNKTSEDADPYVLAEALHLLAEGKRVVVITEDHFDNPSRISMTTACELLGLPHMRIEDFLRAEGLIT